MAGRHPRRALVRVRFCRARVNTTSGCPPLREVPPGHVGTLGRVTSPEFNSPESDSTVAVESRRVRGLVIEAVEAAAAMIGREEVTARWDEPSALAGMTVGALCAHLVRAAGSVLAYLDRTDPMARPDGALLTPVTYLHAAIDSPIHERIKEVSATEATAGPGEVAIRCAEVAATLRGSVWRRSRATGWWPRSGGGCCTSTTSAAPG